MRPSGAHTHPSGDAAEVVGVLVILVVLVAVVAAAVAFVDRYLWLTLPGVFLFVSGVVAGAVHWHRKYGRVPEVLPWRPNSRPRASREPLAAPRPVQTLPAPQVHVHLDAAGVAALLAAGREEQDWRKWTAEVDGDDV